MHDPILNQGQWLRQVVTGFFAYHAVPTNLDAPAAFRYHIMVLWMRMLTRRSQKDRTGWDRINRLADPRARRTGREALASSGSHYPAAPLKQTGAGRHRLGRPHGAAVGCRGDSTTLASTPVMNIGQGRAHPPISSDGIVRLTSVEREAPSGIRDHAAATAFLH